MAQITHRIDDGKVIQVVTPAELRAVLNAEGSDYSRPADFGPDDEWDTGAEISDDDGRLTEFRGDDMRPV